MKRILAAMVAAAAGFCSAATAQESAPANGPVDGGIAMIRANSALAEEVHWFHNLVLMPIITSISLFVLALLLWVIVRYNAKANPTPQKFSHNTMVEVLWTGIPILILLAIALPSFELLYKEDIQPDGKQVVAEGDGSATTFTFANDFPERRMLKHHDHLRVTLASGAGERLLKPRADYSVDGFGEPEIKVTLKTPPARGERVVIQGGRSLVGPSKLLGLIGESRKEIAMAPSVTLKVTGFQWGWTYSYPDFGDFEFSAIPLTEEQTTPELYLFAVDNHVVVPVGETVRVVTNARDVIHSWAMPAFAIKIDAVPGRNNETWFKADREGVFYGQCSEICGVKHSMMPIAVEVVSRPEFEAWVNSQRVAAGMAPMFGAETEVAAVEATPEADTPVIETATEANDTSTAEQPAATQD
jgi:cytochrome c oxidase subunit 2